jgi:hypothetical protein
MRDMVLAADADLTGTGWRPLWRKESLYDNHCMRWCGLYNSLILYSLLKSLEIEVRARSAPQRTSSPCRECETVASAAT